MSEGGLLAWKVQKVKLRGPVADYSKEALTLPNPPKGTHWEKDDETREWGIVPDTPTNATNNDESEPFDTIDLHNDTGNNESATAETKDNQDTDDTNDGSSGPQKGLDYIEHVVLPTDTLQGLCIRYKITAPKIRQANRFTGTNLLLAPSTLLIPLNKDHVISGRICVQDRNSREFKVQAFLDKVIGMSSKEANAYLDMADNDLEEAVRDALDDKEWEKSQQGRSNGGNVPNFRDSVHTGIPIATSDEEKVNDLALNVEMVKLLPHVS